MVFRKFGFNDVHFYKQSIGTADGLKRYFGTEVEDKFGDWDDHYAIRDGFWVVHVGKYHHIYH
jgi:hypothetical protein